MEELKITLLGNGMDYTDNDVIAVVFADEDVVVEEMKKVFLKQCPYKLVNPVYRHFTAQLCWGKSYDQMMEKRYINTARYGENHLGFDESCYVQTTEEDAEESYEKIDRKEFLNHLKEIGIKFIEDFGDIY